MVETAEGISIQQATVEKTAPIITQVEGSTGWLGKLTSLVRGNKFSAVEAQKPEAIANVTEVAVPRPPRKQSEIFADEDAAKRARLEADEMERFREEVAHPASRGRGVERYFSGISLDVMSEAKKAKKTPEPVVLEAAKPRELSSEAAQIQAEMKEQAEEMKAKLAVQGEPK